MPIKRKICKIGTGLAVFIPKSWVRLLEQKHGRVIAFTIEVDDSLVLTPVFEGAEGKGAFKDVKAAE